MTTQKSRKLIKFKIPNLYMKVRNLILPCFEWFLDFSRPFDYCQSDIFYILKFYWPLSGFLYSGKVLQFFHKAMTYPNYSAHKFFGTIDSSARGPNPISLWKKDDAFNVLEHETSRQEKKDLSELLWSSHSPISCMLIGGHL